MEFYSPDLAQHYFTVDKYINFVCEKNDDVTVDTTSLFKYDDYDNGIAIQKEEFRKCESMMQEMLDENGKKLKALHIIVMLNEEYSFWDFITLPEIKELEGENIIYIRMKQWLSIIR